MFPRSWTRTWPRPPALSENSFGPLLEFADENYETRESFSEVCDVMEHREFTTRLLLAALITSQFQEAKDLASLFQTFLKNPSKTETLISMQSHFLDSNDFFGCRELLATYRTHWQIPLNRRFYTFGVEAMLRYAKEKTSKKLENVTNDEREVWNLDSERNLKEKKEEVDGFREAFVIYEDALRMDFDLEEKTFFLLWRILLENQRVESIKMFYDFCNSLSRRRDSGCLLASWTLLEFPDYSRDFSKLSKTAKKMKLHEFNEDEFFFRGLENLEEESSFVSFRSFLIRLKDIRPDLAEKLEIHEKF